VLNIGLSEFPMIRDRARLNPDSESGSTKNRDPDPLPSFCFIGSSNSLPDVLVRIDSLLSNLVVPGVSPVQVWVGRRAVAAIGPLVLVRAINQFLLIAGKWNESMVFGYEIWSFRHQDVNIWIPNRSFSVKSLANMRFPWSSTGTPPRMEVSKSHKI
jgi:hypothetical protein